MNVFKDDKRVQKRIEKAIKKSAKKMCVAVGVLQNKEYLNKKFSIVDLATVHEYGSSNGHIPQRSFIRSTCDSKRKAHINLIKKLQQKVLLGNLSQINALKIFGEVVSKDMVQAINKGIAPALKAKTIQRKKSSKPLIDTGRLKGSITHEIREGS